MKNVFAVANSSNDRETVISHKKKPLARFFFYIWDAN